MCPTDSPSMESLSAVLDVENLCLDFKSKVGSYVEAFRRFLERNRTPLGLQDAEDPVTAYLDRICPSGVPGSVIMSSASFDQFDRWMLRPVTDGPLADSFAAQGLVPTFTGYRRQGAIVIDGFATTNHIAPRPFERRVSGTIHINPENPSMGQTDFAVLTQMPRPRQQTRERLEQFREGLEWRKDLVFLGQQSIRYSSYERGEDGNITFTVHGNGEIVRIARSRGMVMLATGLNYSLSHSRWTPIPRIRPRMVRVGQVAKAWRYDGDGSQPRQADPADRPAGGGVGFIVLQAEGNGDTEDEELEIPDEGFLLSAVGGDMKPINSERRAIDRFISGKGHNWYLGDYLFDIGNAAVPTFVPDAVADPLMPLNERQRSAVNKVLASSDLILIQGPPGTGKSTVIGEICYQEVRRGLRILVASQANVAVDRVLALLSDNPAIRPLRIGKASRIDEEGQVFTPENALHHWLAAAGRICRQRLQAREQARTRIDAAQEAFVRAEGLLIRYQEVSRQIQHINGQAGSIRERRTSLTARHEELSDRAQYCRRLQAVLSELSHSPEQGLRTSASEDLLSTTRLPAIVTAGARNLIKVLSRSPWEIPWLSRDRLNAPLSLLASAQAAILIAESLIPQIPEAVVLCSNDKPSPEDRELAELCTERARLLNSSDDADLLKVAEINRKIKQLQADSWGRLCRIINNALQIVFGSDLPPDLDQLVSSLGPDPKFIGILDGLVCLCTCLTDQCRSVLEASLTQIRQQAQADLADVQAQADQIQKQRSELKPSIDTADHEVDEIEHQLDIRQRHVDECQGRWAELWPALCADLGESEQVPQLSEASLNRRRQQFTQWLEARDSTNDQNGKWHAIQEEWLARLARPETSEDKRFRSLYASQANVVGLTCLEAGQPSFYEDDDFEPYDLVIIDEVSKATPTELLMAMMLARKVVLVGDQRQLSAMLKEKETSFAEALEEGVIKAEDFEKHRNLVTASLFAELFAGADESLRESLFDHYRSHEQIVQIFNPFYDGKLVIAGGADSLNERRQHHLRIKDRNGGWFLEPSQHVLWIDSSRRANGQLFTERQAGSSKVNLLEVELITASLMRLNWGLRRRGYGPVRTVQATSRQNSMTLETWVRQLMPRAARETITDLFNRQQVRIDGRIAPADHVLQPKETVTIDARMPIGVITFYGAQLGQIRKKIAEISAENPCYLDACSIQTNTVDKFQGKEMPTVLVSLVRAPEHRHVGQFVKEYRRINVAFSRAQNLLIIIGNERTFRDVPVEIPSMEDGTLRKVYVYRHIFDLVTQYGGRRYARDLLKW